MMWNRVIVPLLFAFGASLSAQSPSFRYFYYDTGELYRVLDSTGTLIEYGIDPAGNITNVSRASIPSNQLSILNVTPANAIGGTNITIQGQNFSTLAAGNTVKIGGVTATVVSATATQLVVLVPTNTAGGAVSVTVAGVTATWSNTITTPQPPVITTVRPATGTKGATLSVGVAGVNLTGTTFVLKSVDPTGPASAATITVVSTTDTLANLTLVLGNTEGLFALTGTNAVGPGTVTPASYFVIGPVNNSSSFFASVLNTSFNPVTNPPLPAGRNFATFSASVLNTGFDPSTNPTLPAGSTKASFFASVLNTGFDPATNPPLPAGRNSATFTASVLSTGYNPSNTPPIPAGSNSASFSASILNTGFNPITNSPLPAGSNGANFYLSVLNTSFGSGAGGIRTAAGLGVSVCNTNSGCTPIPPIAVSTAAAPAPPRTRPVPPSSGRPPVGALPVLEPLEELATVIAGQTIRLTAQNIEPGSAVEFQVNQVTVGTTAEAPYEALFTVPEGSEDLVFQVRVRVAGEPDRLSQITRITVAPDANASIVGSVAQGANGVELSLAAGGLTAEFFRLPQPVTALPALDGTQPVRTAYVTAINQPNSASVFGDDPLGAHLRSDYAIRFSGEVRADNPGLYRFWLSARSGAALLIDGKLLADTGFASGNPAGASVAVALDRGWHDIEVVYYLAVGSSSVRLEWQPPNRVRREVLGPEYLRTVLAPMTTTSQPDGRFAFPAVPKKFDSVWIRVKRGDGFIEFPAVKAGTEQVSIKVPE